MFENLIQSNLFPWLVMLSMLWSMPWKGIALWKAGRKKHLVWFIILFLVNTLAILEILYIFVFSKQGKKKKKEQKKKKR